MQNDKKEDLIKLAIKEAEKAFEQGNAPFGAVLADENGNVIATAYNTAHTDKDPTAHAEINLIRKVAKDLDESEFAKLYLVSNAQSCTMCFSAAIKAGIKNFIFGADSKKDMSPSLNVYEMAKYTREKPKIESGILKDECEKLIKVWEENR